MTLNTKSPFFPVKYSRPFDSLKPNIPLNLGGHFPQNCGSCSMNTKAFHSLAFTSADPLTRDIEVLNTLMIEKAILPILKKKYKIISVLKVVTSKHSWCWGRKVCLLPQLFTSRHTSVPKEIRWLCTAHFLI